MFRRKSSHIHQQSAHRVPTSEKRWPLWEPAKNACARITFSVNIRLISGNFMMAFIMGKSWHVYCEVMDQLKKTKDAEGNPLPLILFSELKCVLFSLFMTIQTSTMWYYLKDIFHKYVLSHEFHLQITDNTLGFIRYVGWKQNHISRPQHWSYSWSHTTSW